MNFNALIDQLITLEANVAELYRLFAHLFETDRSFWLQMAHEETLHAQMINQNRPLITKLVTLSKDSLVDLTEITRLMAERIRKLTREYRNKPPGKTEAYLCALQVEQSAGEIHFQKIAARLNNPRAKLIFLQLNGNDQEHVDRIRAQMCYASEPAAPVPAICGSL